MQKQISTVTKQIKVYSDNPIHDAIDQIIDNCTLMDEGKSNATTGLLGLHQATEKLLSLTQERLYGKK